MGVAIRRLRVSRVEEVPRDGEVPPVRTRLVQPVQVLLAVAGPVDVGGGVCGFRAVCFVEADLGVRGVARCGTRQHGLAVRGADAGVGRGHRGDGRPGAFLGPPGVHADEGHHHRGDLREGVTAAADGGQRGRE